MKPEPNPHARRLRRLASQQFWRSLGHNIAIGVVTVPFVVFWSLNIFFG